MGPDALFSVFVRWPGLVAAGGDRPGTGGNLTPSAAAGDERRRDVPPSPVRNGISSSDERDRAAVYMSRKIRKFRTDKFDT